MVLGKHATAWWRWAWSTPQAAGWSVGDAYALARRAALEDDLAALELADEFDFESMVGADEREVARTVEYVIRKLKALAGGKMSLLREARELDDRFGLTAKGLAALRWTIVAEVEVKDEVAAARARRPRRAKAVDAGAVAGS
jgi:hypothetical protein